MCHSSPFFDRAGRTRYPVDGSSLAHPRIVLAAGEGKYRRS